jgi:hypothetical protein
MKLFGYAIDFFARQGLKYPFVMEAARQFAVWVCPVGSQSSHMLFQQVFEPLSGDRLLDRYQVVICEECGAGFGSR